MRSQITVYTCVAQRYEREIARVRPEPGIDFVCFTDSPKHLTAPGWDVRLPKSPKRLSSGHDINRYHKAFPHVLFPQSRWSIYFDGNLAFSGDYRNLIRRVKNAKASLGAFWHPNGHSLEEEVEVCRRLKFDQRDMAMIEQQIAFYAANGIDPKQPIPTNNLLVRDHFATGLDTAMAIWFSHLYIYSKRDQISLLYALQAAGIDWQPLDGDGEDAIDPTLVQIKWHKPPIIRRLKNRLRKQFGLIT